MKLNRIKQLAGLVTEADDGVVSLGLVFKLEDHENMRRAVDALLASGMNIDLSFSMGVYFFTFPTPSLAKEARTIVAGVINTSAESNWTDANLSQE